MKHGALFIILVNLISANGMHAMEVTVLEPLQPDNLFHKIIKCSIDTTFQYLDYRSVIKALELKCRVTEKNGIGTAFYALNMIKGESACSLIAKIDEEVGFLDDRIEILHSLYGLPDPVRCKVRGERSKQEDKELENWWKAKITIYEEYDKKVKEHECEKQQVAIEQKLTKNKRISLTEWNNYLFSLIEYKKTLKDQDKKASVSTTIDDIKKKVALEHQKLELKKIVADIRQSPAVDIEELRNYKQQLIKYVELLPAEAPQQLSSKETISCVEERINLLLDIDGYLLLDNSIFSSRGTMIVLQELQKQLNKPNSERHIRLSEKIAYIEGLVQ